MSPQPLLLCEFPIRPKPVRIGKALAPKIQLLEINDILRSHYANPGILPERSDELSHPVFRKRNAVVMQSNYYFSRTFFHPLFIDLERPRLRLFSISFTHLNLLTSSTVESPSNHQQLSLHTSHNPALAEPSAPSLCVSSRVIGRYHNRNLLHSLTPNQPRHA